MTSTLEVSISAEGGVSLHGWLFVPDGTGPHPAVTMAHGFGGSIQHGLEPFAVSFAEAVSSSCCMITVVSAAVAASRDRT